MSGSMDSELKGYAKQLVDALRDQYRLSEIAKNLRIVDGIRDGSCAIYTNDEATITYFQNENRKLIRGEKCIDVQLICGKRYSKITLNGKIHCYINSNTGAVYPGTSRPRRINIRHNLRDTRSREICLRRATWCGGYLM